MKWKHVICGVLLVALLTGCKREAVETSALDAGVEVGNEKVDFGENSDMEAIVVPEKTWTDDTIIPFPDEGFRKEIQEITGVTERDITYGDVKYITDLGYDYFYGYGYTYDSWDVLKYFDSLKTLYVTIDSQAEASQMSVLLYLENLEELGLMVESDSNVEKVDLAPIYQLKNLQSLELQAAGLDDLELDLAQMANLENMYCLRTNVPVKNMGCLSQCHNMQDLRMWNEQKIDNIEFLNNMPRLEYLTLSGNFDPQILENCKLPLVELEIHGNEKLTNLDFLLTSTCLSERLRLYIHDCNNLTDSSAVERVDYEVSVDKQ